MVQYVNCSYCGTINTFEPRGLGAGVITAFSLQPVADPAVAAGPSIKEKLRELMTFFEESKKEELLKQF